MSKILCIHPYDKSTTFLNRIQTFLIRELGDQIHYFRVQPHEISHKECLLRLSKVEEKFIIFLGHGRSDSLYGAVSNDLRGYTTGNYLYRGNYRSECFITEHNLEVFRNKKVFCLSCNSADKLGRLTCEKGATAFLGFGDIPTDGEILNGFGKEMKYFKGNFRGEIVKIIKKSLLHSIKSNHNFAELQQTIRIVTNIRIRNILRNKHGIKHKRLLVDHLLNLSEQMKTFGDVNIPIFD